MLLGFGLSPPQYDGTTIQRIFLLQLKELSFLFTEGTDLLAHLVFLKEHGAVALILSEHLGHDYRAYPARAIMDVLPFAVIKDRLILTIVE